MEIIRAHGIEWTGIHVICLNKIIAVENNSCFFYCLFALGFIYQSESGTASKRLCNISGNKF